MPAFEIRRKSIRAYLFLIRAIWWRLPDRLRISSPGQAFGEHVHGVVRRCVERRQSFGTVFRRNRAELELMRRLWEQKVSGSNLDIAVLGCSNRRGLSHALAEAR